MDYWANSQEQLPSFMEGTFTAVDNTIEGLADGDSIIYLPLNVMYGISDSNGVWFQFDVRFDSYGNVHMNIWDNLISGWNSYYMSEEVGGGVDYVVGHTYYFSLTTNGIDVVRFWIEDYNTGEHWEKTGWHWNIPAFNMIYSLAAFSPASAVEGWTTNAELTNVPFLRSDVGYDLPTHWIEYYGWWVKPSGIYTRTWGGPGNYIWAMQSNGYIASVNRYGGYGNGYVSNQNAIAGSGPDGNSAYYYGGNPGDGGYIIGNMNTISGGDIVVYARTAPYYTSTLYVYVSIDDYNWYQVGSPLKITSTYQRPYYIGTVNYGFKYMAVVGYDAGNSVSMYVDNSYTI